MTQSGQAQQVDNFALDQILPVSFTINLFFVAMLLAPSDAPRHPVRVPRSVPNAIHQVILVLLYFAALRAAPSSVAGESLVTLVLFTRVLMFYPYMGFRPNRFRTLQSEGTSPGPFKENKDEGQQGLWQAYKPTILTVAICHILLQLQIVRGVQASANAGPVSHIMLAISHDPAVSALGYDFLIAVSSLVLWFATNVGGGNGLPERVGDDAKSQHVI